MLQFPLKTKPKIYKAVFIIGAHLAAGFSQPCEPGTVMHDSGVVRFTMLIVDRSEIKKKKRNQKNNNNS